MRIYLDTHALIWLFTKKESAFSPKILKLIENSDLVTGEINVLELELLHEIGRIKYSSLDISKALKTSMNLHLADISSEAILEAVNLSWTRDIFDRITVAGAKVLGAKLITKDSNILDNFDQAIW